MPRYSEFAFISCFFLFMMASLCRASEDAFNLGLLGAEGIPMTKKEVEEFGLKGRNAIRLTAILEGCAAEKAGLKKGDIVIGVGKSFLPEKKNPIHALVEFVEVATSSKDARLPLIVNRDGQNMTFVVELPYLGKHSSTCPLRCQRCDVLIEQSLKFLAEQQESGGSFPCQLGGTTGKVVVTSICGLAFIASGSTNRHGPYAEVIDKAAKYVAKNCGKRLAFSDETDGVRGGNWNQVNWAYAYASLFLAELYHKEHCDELRERLIDMSQQLVRNQEVSGGWAHGPGGPNALGYVELAAVGNVVLSSLGMMRQLKLVIPDETIEKGTNYLLECSRGDGGIGYSARPGEKGVGDPGRTAGTIFAFFQLGMSNHPFMKKMSDYFWRRMEEVPNGHVSPTMHFTASALACCHLPPKYWNKFIKTFKLDFIAARRPDGSFAARPTHEDRLFGLNTDRAMGDCWTTGSYLLILQMRKGHVPLLTGIEKKTR